MEPLQMQLVRLPMQPLPLTMQLGHLPPLGRWEVRLQLGRLLPSGLTPVKPGLSLGWVVRSVVHPEDMKAMNKHKLLAVICFNVGEETT